MSFASVVPPSRPYIGTLEANPALHLEDVLDNLHRYSATLCRQHLTGGLATLHPARTPARFAALGLLEIDPATDQPVKDPVTNLPVPRSYPKLPTKPAQPSTTGAGAAQVYALEMAEYLDIHAGIGELRDAIISALGTKIQLELQDRLADMSLPQILEYLDQEYSEASEDDIRALKQGLNVQFQSVNTFRSDAARMKQTFRKLDKFKCVIPEDERMDLLVAATRHIPPVVAAILSLSILSTARTHTMELLKF